MSCDYRFFYLCVSLFQLLFVCLSLCLFCVCPSCALVCVMSVYVSPKEHFFIKTETRIFMCHIRTFLFSPSQKGSACTADAWQNISCFLTWKVADWNSRPWLHSIWVYVWCPEQTRRQPFSYLGNYRWQGGRESVREWWREGGREGRSAQNGITRSWSPDQGQCSYFS